MLAVKESNPMKKKHIKVFVLELMTPDNGRSMVMGVFPTRASAQRKRAGFDASMKGKSIFEPYRFRITDHILDCMDQ
jgi:hypothetical protein